MPCCAVLCCAARRLERRSRCLTARSVAKSASCRRWRRAGCCARRLCVAWLGMPVLIRRYPSTIHGAYLSGSREAERVAEAFKVHKVDGADDGANSGAAEPSVSAFAEAVGCAACRMAVLCLLAVVVMRRVARASCLWWVGLRCCVRRNRCSHRPPPGLCSRADLLHAPTRAALPAIGERVRVGVQLLRLSTTCAPMNRFEAICACARERAEQRAPRECLATCSCAIAPRPSAPVLIRKRGSRRLTKEGLVNIHILGWSAGRCW